MTEIETLQEIRLRHMRDVLEHTNGDVLEASRILGISPVTLRKMLRELGSPDQTVGEE